MKVQTGVFAVEKSDKEKQYESKLAVGTASKISEFSALVLQLANKWTDKEVSKIAIKDKVNDLKQSEGNTSGLIEYLEYLIVHNGNYEFAMPYYSLCHGEGLEINEHIAQHENSKFGILGDVNEILQ
jgi:hypothetical protein